MTWEGKSPPTAPRNHIPAFASLQPLEDRLLLSSWAPGPIVVEAIINAAGTSRSRLDEVSLTFDRNVSVAPDALTLWDHQLEQSRPFIGEGFSYDDQTLTARWPLQQMHLPGGYYTLRLAASGVTDGLHVLDGNANGRAGDDFFLLVHCLPGDANGNAAVDVDDLGVLASQYRQSGTNLASDFNADGVVNVDDLGILATNYGKQLAATDLTPPAVTELEITGLQFDGFIVQFLINEPAQAWIEWGATAACELASVQADAIGMGFTAELAGLLGETTYWFRIVAVNEAGNVATTHARAVTTAKGPLEIFDPQVLATSRSLELSFTVGRRATVVVEYGLSEQLELGTMPSPPSSAHRIVIDSLPPAREIYYRITAFDAEGNEVVLDGLSASTLAAPVFYSDDFNSLRLDPAWIPVDPRGDGTISLDGKRVLLAVPAGVSHNAWTDGNNTLRLMQSAANEDLHIQVGFQSRPLGTNAMQGVIVQDDVSNYLRFCFYSVQNYLHMFVAAAVDDQMTVIRNVSVPDPSADEMHLRVIRQGDDWIVSRSYDGVEFVPVVGFQHVLEVSAVGVFAGNAGTSPPAHTAVVDYFFNLQAPIENPDSRDVSTLAWPVMSERSRIPGPDFVELGFQTDRPAVALVQYGLTDRLELGVVVGDGANLLHALRIEGLELGLTYFYRVAVFGDHGHVVLDDIHIAAPQPPDVTPPVIGQAIVRRGLDWIEIEFDTDEPATVFVDFGLGEDYELGTVSAEGGMVHVLRIEGLEPDNEYHLRIRAVDAAGNESQTDPFTVRTLAVREVQSDDFNYLKLDTSRWTFIDPLGDATLAFNGMHALIGVPAGTAHDIWTAGALAPRLMQEIDDFDFQIAAKFDSRPQGVYAMHGLLVQQGDGGLLRLDLHSALDGMNVYAATFANGKATMRVHRAVLPADVMYLRLTRQGHSWTADYSYDGAEWILATAFTHETTVTSVGVFAGNSGADAPAYTAAIDYFFNTDYPIDPVNAVDLTPPTVSGVQLVTDPAGVEVRFQTNEPALVSIQYGRTIAYELGVISGPQQWQTQHSIFLPGLDATLKYHFRILAVDEAGNARTGEDMIICPDQAGPFIDVWYGDHQVFGHIGTLQRWVNILGNVSPKEGLSHLSYTLNGGSSRPLTVGPDNLRLANLGDFNIDIDRNDLEVGMNTVVITAADAAGNLSQRTVTIEYHDDNAWPLPYVVDWSDAAKVSQVAQVVDGLWVLEDGSLRIVETGYDRLVGIGDHTWSEYEVLVPITINAWDETVYANGHVPAFGVLMRWAGHYEWNSSQPAHGWWPLGGLAWYTMAEDGESSLQIYGNTGPAAVEPDRILDVGVTYLWRVRINEDPSGYTRVSLKVWQDGTPEPTSWDLSVLRYTNVPASGSVMLVAHYCDVSFGTVTVTPL